MKTIETEFRAPDGQALHVLGWEPDAPPNAVVLLTHGLGEHVARYAHVGAALAQAGYALIGFDLRGHGRTQGPRGYAPSLTAILQDMDSFAGFVRGRYPADTPVFQYGHSLGALLTVAYHLARKPAVAGVVIGSPGFASSLVEQKGKLLLVRALGSLLPRLSLPTGLDSNMISRDAAVVRAYVDDPLVHDQASLSLAKAGLDAIDYAFEHAAEMEAPLLIMHGTADQLTYARGGQAFLQRVGSQDAVFKPWEGLYHELHNEPEQGQVLRHVIDWLEAHLPRRTA
jgi:alpha-beta hydrolase superfamily lysophospholipase